MKVEGNQELVSLYIKEVLPNPDDNLVVAGFAGTEELTPQDVLLLLPEEYDFTERFNHWTVCIVEELAPHRVEPMCLIYRLVAYSNRGERVDVAHLYWLILKLTG